MNNLIECRIKELLIQILGEELQLEEVGYEDNFIDVGLNSINFIKWIVAIENDFNIELDDEVLELDKFNNIKGLANYINSIIKS